jgi:hypothetical protein
VKNPFAQDLLTLAWAWKRPETEEVKTLVRKMLILTHKGETAEVARIAAQLHRLACPKESTPDSIDGRLKILFNSGSSLAVMCNATGLSKPAVRQRLSRLSLRLRERVITEPQPESCDITK